MKTIHLDGSCNLCRSYGQFLQKRDHKKIFRFGFTGPGAQSIVFNDNGTIYQKSDAVLRIIKYLPGLWKLLYFLKIIPRFFRDRVYDIIARNRYRVS